MERFVCLLAILFFSFLSASCSQFRSPHPAVTRPVPITTLSHYSHDSVHVKKVIARALWLSKKHLTYIFGSDDPRNGGMDCSGVLYYLLKSIKAFDVPRDSYEMYMWLLRDRKIHYVTSDNFHSYQFNALRPGDLLFWTNTYYTHRKPPITHVMLYLGKNKNNEPLIFGSSDGGIYKGMEMWGVSVFDFILPNDRNRERFVAYGCIPFFTCWNKTRKT